MTSQEMSIFLQGAILLCAIMAVFNVWQYRRRGWTSLLLSSAFLLMGYLIFLYKNGSSPGLLQGGSLILFVMLVIDFIVRAGKQPSRKRR